MKWTEEQLAVIQAADGRFAVSASAGAGKTGVLVERYVEFVKSCGLHADEILAITFTRKAAAEMKRRIVFRLRELGLDVEARLAETGPIQTIHGFCERILRENSLAAGIDPRFSIADSGSRYRLEAMQTVLSRLDDQSPEVEEVLRAYAGLRVGPAGVDVLGRQIDRLLNQIRGSGLSPARLMEVYGSAESGMRFAREEVARRFEVDVPPDAPEWAKLMREMVPKAKAGPFQIVQADDESAYRRLAGLVKLATDVWSEMETRMKRDQQFDFILLESLAVELVASREDVQRRIAATYKALLIDEAQDNNPVQYRLLYSLPIESLMLVGDVKQSIYGFRLAAPHLFDESTRQMKLLRLSVNHRSEHGVQRFVDAVFERQWEEDYVPMNPGGAGFQGVELWNVPPMREGGADGLAQCALAFFEETGAKRGETALLVSAHNEGVRLRAALEAVGIPARSTGGRFYARLEIRDAANALRALADPYDDFSLLALLRSPFADIGPDLWTRLALKPPVYEGVLADEDPQVIRFREWFVPLAKHADRKSAYEALADLFAKSPWMEGSARRPDRDVLIANARKLLDLAAARPEVGPSEFAEQIREIQRFDEREELAPTHDDGEEVVTIMTAHAAKGLEWPNVIVASTWTGAKPADDDVLVDPTTGLLTVKHPSNAADAVLRSARTDAEARELWRKAYVALTRARNRLCVVVTPGRRTLGSDILRAVEKQFPADQIRVVSE